MMRKISYNLFLRITRTPYRRFSTGDQIKQQKPKVESEAPKQQALHKNQNPQTQDEDFQYQKQDRTTKGWMIYRFLFWGTTSILGYHLYKVATHDKKTPIEDQFTGIPVFLSAAKFIFNQYNNTAQFFTKPPMQKLLPDVIHPLMHPKTLVLNVTGTLLETKHVFGKGLVVKKRPGLNQFLKKMSQMYEVIIFSDDDSMHLETLIQNMDPRQQIFAGYFGHECMILSGTKYIKDLKYLNRDLKNIVVIDISKDKVAKHPQNVITLPVFHGQADDRQLYNLTVLLESLAVPQIKDVRKALAKLGDDPAKKYAESLKQKQQKIKNNKSNKFFGLIAQKKK